MTLRAPGRSAAVLTLLALAGFARAEVKDPAELLPAQTLVCVEVRQPERLAREVAALLKGSAFDDMPTVMSRFRARMGDNAPFWFYNEAAALSMFFSPEMINECGRIQGGAFAVTGVSKDGPEMVGVLQAGDSNLPTFYLRVMLTVDSNVRQAAEVEGVNIYREHRQIYTATPVIPGGAPAPPKWEDAGPFMALLPSTIVLGSTAESVKDVIRRYKGKSSEPSLASVAAYKEAAKERDRPGLFAYTDLAALAQRMDEAGKSLGSAERQWRVVKAAVNPKAVRSATASLTLQNGAVELKAHVEMDPRQASPLVDLLTAKAAPPDVLYFTPRDGMLTLSLNLNDGEKRWDTLMELIDALDKPEPGEPERPAPSAALRALEDRAKLHIAKDVLGRLTAAAVTANPEAASSPAGRPLPLLVLQATDADAAKYLEEQGLPKLIGLMAGDTPAPIREDVGGRSISAVASAGLESVLNAKNLYVGREGAFVVIGSDRKEVVAALDAGAAKAGLLGQEQTAAAVKDLEDPLAVGLFSLGKGIVEGFKQMERPAPTVTFAPAVAPLPPPPAVGPVPAPAEKPPAEQPKLSKRAEKTIEDVARAVDPLPPAVLSLGRKPDGLTLELRQAGLKGVTARVIDLWVDGLLERALESQRPNGR